MKTAHCIICGKEFPKDRNYITCGSPECRRQNNLRKQREAYQRVVAQREVQKAARLAVEQEAREAKERNAPGSRAKDPWDDDPLPGWKSPMELLMDRQPRDYERLSTGELLNVFDLHRLLRTYQLRTGEKISHDGGTYQVISAGDQQKLIRTGA